MDRNERRRINRRLKFLVDRYSELNKREKSFLLDFKYHFRKKEINSVYGKTVQKFNRLFRKYNKKENEKKDTVQEIMIENGQLNIFG